MFPAAVPAILGLDAPNVSISSIKRIQGESCLALSNRSLNLCDPDCSCAESVNALADSTITGTFDSPARACTTKVLPVPGGPTSRIPLGICPPRPELLRYQTISPNSGSIESIPATSLNRLSALAIIFIGDSSNPRSSIIDCGLKPNAASS